MSSKSRIFAKFISNTAETSTVVDGAINVVTPTSGGGSVDSDTILSLINNLPIQQNYSRVTTDFVIDSDHHAVSAGPITIDSDVTVTIPENSVWTIV